MSEVDIKEKHAEVIRKLIEHENTLQNYRFTWFSTAQALLFAALGFAWDKGTTFLVYLICIVGASVAISAIAALHLSDLAYSALDKWWRSNLSDYTGPPQHGYDVGGYSLLRVMPSKLLPWIFMLTWLVVALHRFYWHVPILCK